MYPALLTRRYLTSRVIPLVAVGAVALCVALVMTVISVMTGFLDLVRDAGRTLMGDVVIAYPVRGMPYYDDLIKRIEEESDVLAATPVVDGWGLLKMPYPLGPRKETETVQFWAVEPESFAQVTGYADTLYWRNPDEATLAEMSETDFRRDLLDRLGPDGLDKIYNNGLTLEAPADGDGLVATGTALGMHVSQGNSRQSDGSYRPAMADGGMLWWMPLFPGELVLTTIPTDTLGTSPEPRSVPLTVVNEFQSGVFLIDDKRIILPLDVGQRLLRLDEAVEVDDEGEETGLSDPARATLVLVRAKDGVTPAELLPSVVRAYESFWDDIRTRWDAGEIPQMALPPHPTQPGLAIQTWMQQQAAFIAPIEKEREVMRTLFMLVYIVCAGLVLSIFWAIVYEKTRDIGILRSVGASRLGIASIFVRYGLVIGVLGAICGFGLASLVVGNINAIHDAIGDPPRWLAGTCLGIGSIALIMTLMRARSGLLLPIVLGSLLAMVFLSIGGFMWFFQGATIWDPSVYYFNEIPSRIDFITASTTMVGAVIFSVLGAFFPAAKAADIDPVSALRYE